jgi:hypothetical protein
MFKVYGGVSSEEFNDSLDFSKQEFGIAVKAIAVAISIGINNCEATKLVAKITPNARLRLRLISAAERISAGVPFSQSLATYCLPGIKFDAKPFYTACCYGEYFNKLGEMLLMYAKDSGVPEHALANQIGWSRNLQVFFEVVAKSLNDNALDGFVAQPDAFMESVGLLKIMMSGTNDFYPTLQSIIENVGHSHKIADVFSELELLDPFSLAVIKTAEEKDIQSQKDGKEDLALCNAFQLLAEA